MTKPVLEERVGQVIEAIEDAARDSQPDDLTEKHQWLVRVAVRVRPWFPTNRLCANTVMAACHDMGFDADILALGEGNPDVLRVDWVNPAGRAAYVRLGAVAAA